MDQIRPQQTLVKNEQLSELLGIDRSTLHRWTVEDPKLRGCVFRRGYYSVQKLRDAKILTDGSASTPGLSPGLADDLAKLAQLCTTIAAKIREEAGRHTPCG